MYHHPSQFAGYTSAHQPGHHPKPPLQVQTSIIQRQPSNQYPSYSYTPSPATTVAPARQYNQMPSSPSESTERNGPRPDDDDFSDLPGPEPTCHLWNNRIWCLEIAQHPQRARMCGFGDKDRRPISPPPCIRVIILDAATRREIDYESVNLEALVLSVDIFDKTAYRESNLVKQSNASPCISSSATSAFPVTERAPPPNVEIPKPYRVENPEYGTYPPAMSTTTTNPMPSRSYSGSGTMTSLTTNPSGQPSPYHNHAPVPPYGQQHYYDPSQYRPQAPPPPPPSAFSPAQQYPQMHMPINTQPGFNVNSNSASTIYTRNLIGSLSASAFRLKDEQGKLGIWFVLQDLSVRTEGWFRLKMCLYDLSAVISEQIEAASSKSTKGEPEHSARPATVEKDRGAPCLATVYSQPFKVFSAKKFPGVVESTALSKCFAAQGIKIPIRKDAPAPTSNKRKKESDSDDEASDGEGSS